MSSTLRRNLIALAIMAVMLCFMPVREALANLIASNAPRLKTAVDATATATASGTCASGDAICQGGSCPLTMTATAGRTCTGYHVSNEVYIYGAVGEAGFTAQVYSFIQPGGQAILSAEFMALCNGTNTSTTSTNSPCPQPSPSSTPSPETCPTPPASKPKPAENCTWNKQWCTWICTFDDCDNLGYNWNFTAGKCSVLMECSGTFQTATVNKSRGTVICNPRLVICTECGTMKHVSARARLRY